MCVAYTAFVCVGEFSTKLDAGIKIWQHISNISNSPNHMTAMKTWCRNESFAISIWYFYMWICKSYANAPPHTNPHIHLRKSPLNGTHTLTQWRLSFRDCLEILHIKMWNLSTLFGTYYTLFIRLFASLFVCSSSSSPLSLSAAYAKAIIVISNLMGFHPQENATNHQTE